MENLGFWILVWFAVSAIIALIEFSLTLDHWDEPVVYHPDLIYKNTKMNKFGCWFCFILIRLVSPLFTIFALLMMPILYIADFIHWIFTVGRNDD